MRRGQVFSACAKELEKQIGPPVLSIELKWVTTSYSREIKSQVMLWHEVQVGIYRQCAWRWQQNKNLMECRSHKEAIRKERFPRCINQKKAYFTLWIAFQYVAAVCCWGAALWVHVRLFLILLWCLLWGPLHYRLQDQHFEGLIMLVVKLMSKHLPAASST